MQGVPASRSAPPVGGGTARSVARLSGAQRRPSGHVQHLRDLGESAQRKVGQQGAELLGLFQVEPVVGALEKDLRRGMPGGVGSGVGWGGERGAGGRGVHTAWKLDVIDG